MKRIPLTKGEFALVDDEDFVWLSQWKWCCHVDKSGQKYARRIAYKGRKRKLIMMHKIVKAPPEGMINDHRDRNGLNNQKDNLRPCTRSQNCMNRNPRKTSKTGFKGIAFAAKLGKWVAFVRTCGKFYHLGVFTDPVSAAKAYNRKALEMFGEFARLNDI